MFYQYSVLNDKPYYCEYHVGELSFPSHLHAEAEMLYCEKGSGYVDIEADRYNLSEGNLCIINSFEKHEVSGFDDGCRIVMLIFEKELFEKIYSGVFSRYYSRHIVPVRDEANLKTDYARIMQLFMNLSALCDGSGHESRLMTVSHIYEVIALLSRNEQMVAVDASKAKERGRLIAAISPVLDYVSGHYMDDITLAKASDVANYEEKSFCRIFKLATGLSFHRYLNGVRVRHAQNALANSDLKVYEVGENCGIASPRVFCRIFKNYTGLSPAEYREKTKSSGGM
ncbi:MAG: AraC family transcriptional regulator [Clostridia bacterium]|nr:AraC family transcriptional regulator [Clostridia bacterium]